MKTVSIDLVCLDSTLESKSNAINSTRTCHAIRNGWVNSMKVDCLKSRQRLMSDRGLGQKELLFASMPLMGRVRSPMGWHDN